MNSRLLELAEAIPEEREVQEDRDIILRGSFDLHKGKLSGLFCPLLTETILDKNRISVHVDIESIRIGSVTPFTKRIGILQIMDQDTRLDVVQAYLAANAHTLRTMSRLTVSVSMEEMRESR